MRSFTSLQSEVAPAPRCTSFYDECLSRKVDVYTYLPAFLTIFNSSQRSRAPFSARLVGAQRVRQRR
jgi:hypothetical protein